MDEFQIRKQQRMAEIEKAFEKYRYRQPPDNNFYQRCAFCKHCDVTTEAYGGESYSEIDRYYCTYFWDKDVPGVSFRSYEINEYGAVCDAYTYCHEKVNSYKKKEAFRQQEQSALRSPAAAAAMGCMLPTLLLLLTLISMALLL